ncbi:putative isomerase YddE [Tsuneonella dongtanensis]|uniref:Putative isomerase YddE n=1 Tax=Tsuneonella dongtanensis TaxID=692370 RepID=A0A1B2A9T6_9SPHN|nr:PhzF family phenazine biosynthesis protein [Tsuneonella dongtanensis]ANY18920.1 putative isomerase YddE [Tsuneonella dongtanensis]
MKLAFWHVDAFADRAYAGNPAGVVQLDDWLPDAALAAIADELQLPATAFLVPRADEWEVRWRTPWAELMLCGHASLACGHVLLGRDGADRVTLLTRAGDAVEVRRASGGYELALRAIRTQPRERPDAEALLGARPLETWRNADRYGIYLFASEAEVHALSPDFEALSHIGNDQFACTARGSASDVVSRVFVGGPGAREDAVTGSAHAALAPFWAERLGRGSFTAHQASDRGGDLTCRMEGDRVWLGGRCTTVVEGALYVPG